MNETVNNRILLIDDMQEMHEAYLKYLKSEGTSEKESSFKHLEAMLLDTEPQKNMAEEYEIHSAFQGKEGYEMVKKSIESNRPYAMAFVDMRMPPGWNGSETIEKIWGIDPDIQIVICTAYSDHSLEGISKKLQNKEKLLILKKPFDGIEIKQMTMSLVHKWGLAKIAKDTMSELEDRVAKKTKDLQQVQVQLLHSDKMASIGQLAAGVAHEINNPLGFVSSNFNTLQKYMLTIQEVVELYLNNKVGSIDESKNKKIRMILDDFDDLFSETNEGLVRIKGIVSDLKAFSRKDEPDEIIEGDINEAILSTLQVANNEIKYVAKVETDLGDLPLVLCNLGGLNQAFLNILLNATHAIGLKKSDALGEIKIKTFEDGDFVKCIFSDNGAGMSSEIKKRVFEPFFTTKKIGEGTGLGLHITWDIIVNNHQGSIEVMSKENEGTRFVICLPKKTNKSKEV